MEGLVQALALLSGTITYSLPSAPPQPVQRANPTTREWVPPKLTYDPRADCRPVYERQVPGFGVFRVRLGCINDTVSSFGGRGQ